MVPFPKSVRFRFGGSWPRSRTALVLCRSALIASVVLAAFAARAETILGLLGRNRANETALIRFDSATPSTITARIPVTGLPANDHLLTIDLRPTDAKVYAVSALGGVYIVDALTGVITQIGRLSVPIDGNAVFGMDFDPVADLAGRPSLRLISNLGDNLQVDVRPRHVGAATRLPHLVLVDGGRVFATAYDHNDLSPLTASALYHLGKAYDTRSSESLGVILYKQKVQNSGVVLRVGLSKLSSPSGTWGFDISGSGVAFATITNDYGPPIGPPLPASSFYRVDLARGVVRRIGSIGLSNFDVVLSITALERPRRYPLIPCCPPFIPGPVRGPAAAASR